MKIEQSIRHYEAFIEKLNKATFQDPHTRQRPPTEYLEAFNTYTEQIHQLQMQMNEVAALQSRNRSSSASSKATCITELASDGSDRLSGDDESMTQTPQSPLPSNSSVSSLSSQRVKRLCHFNSFDETKAISSQITSPLPLASYQETLMTQSKTNLSMIQTGGGGVNQSAFAFPAMNPSSYIKVFFGNNSAVVRLEY